MEEKIERSTIEEDWEVMKNDEKKERELQMELESARLSEEIRQNLAAVNKKEPQFEPVSDSEESENENPIEPNTAEEPPLTQEPLLVAEEKAQSNVLEDSSEIQEESFKDSESEDEMESDDLSSEQVTNIPLVFNLSPPLTVKDEISPQVIPSSEIETEQEKFAKEEIDEISPPLFSPSLERSLTKENRLNDVSAILDFVLYVSFGTFGSMVFNHFVVSPFLRV